MGYKSHRNKKLYLKATRLKQVVTLLVNYDSKTKYHGTIGFNFRGTWFSGRVKDYSSHCSIILGLAVAMVRRSRELRK